MNYVKCVKMDNAIIFVVFFIFLNEVINSDQQFPNQYSSKLVEINCSESNFGGVNFSTIEIIVYQPECVLNKSELVFDSDVLNQFKNVHTINISSLGIEMFNFHWLMKINIKTNEKEARDKLNITTFIASHNHFNAIQKDIFKHMPNIREIDFSSNKIQMIESSNFRLDSSDFRSNLAIINCSDNLITQLNHGVFSKLYNLHTLDLSKNKISQFDYNIFPRELHFVHVHLPMEELEELDASCGQLKDLISFCHFNGFDDKVNFKHLIRFNVSGNQINVSKLLGKLGSNIEVLDLSRNFMDENGLKFGAMENFTKLTYLNLSRTNISKIEVDAFYYQVKLISLDLSHNALVKLNPDIFPTKFIHIKTINLDENPLETIEAINPKKIPNLVNLGIQGIKLHCDDLQRLETWREETRFNLNRSLNFSQLEIEKIDECTSENPDDEKAIITTTQKPTHPNIISWELILYAVIGTACCIGKISLIVWLIRRKCSSKIVIQIEESNQDQNSETNKLKDIPSNYEPDYEDIEMIRPTSFCSVPINYPQNVTTNLIAPSAPFLSTQPQAYHHYATVNKQNHV